MTYSVKKIAAFLLALAMMVNLLPAGVLAEDYNKNSDPIEINFTKGGNRNGSENEPMPATTAIALTDIATINQLTVTANNVVVANNGTVREDAELKFSFNFSIQDDNLGTAKENIPWTFNLNESGLFGANNVFPLLTSEQSGILLNGTQEVGTYTIDTDGTVKLTPYKWLNSQTTGVGGSFSFTSLLNETYTQNQQGYTFAFPGQTSTTVTFLHKEIESNKNLYRYKGEQTKLAEAITYDKYGSSDQLSNTADAGTVTVIDAGDGSYRLFYQIRTRINAVPKDSFTITDTLTGGQILLPGTLAVYLNDDKANVIRADDCYDTELQITNGNTNFTLDLKSVLERKYPDNPSKYAGQYIWIEYYTCMDDAELNKEQINTAQLTYDGKTVTPSTKITPQYEKTLKPVKKIANKPAMNESVYGQNQEMVVGPQGNVYFLTGGTLSSPATALSVADNSVGVAIDRSTIRFAIGSEGADYQGYELYTDLLEADVCTFTTGTDVSGNPITTGFTFDVYKAVKWLVETKDTNSQGKHFSDLYKDYFYGSGDGFTLKSGTTFKVNYEAHVLPGYMPGDDPQGQVSNNATWTSNYTEQTVPLSVTLQPDEGSPTIEKTAFDLGSNPAAAGEPLSEDPHDQIDAGFWARYEIKVANKTVDGQVIKDMAGAVVTDRINNYISAIPEKIEIYNSAGDLIAVYNTTIGSWTKGAELGLSIRVRSKPVGIAEGIHSDDYPDIDKALDSLGEEYELFELTFPTDREFNDEYTIKYAVQIDTDTPEGDGIYGLHAVKNWGGIGIGTGEATTSRTTNIWYPFPRVAKRFVEWDKKNNQMVWAVDINLIQLSKIERPLQVLEYYYSCSTWITSNSKKSINADKITFEAVDSQGNKLSRAASETGALINEYIIDEGENTAYPYRKLIFPKGIDRDVSVLIRMDLPDNLDDVSEYHTHNTAYVDIDGNSTDVTADGDYIDTDFGLAKEGEFYWKTDTQNNTKTPMIRWTIDLNKKGKKLENDFSPDLKDIMPAGLSIESMTIIGEKSSPAGSFVLVVPNTSWPASGQTFNLIDLIANLWGSAEKTNVTQAPSSLSTWHFQIEYETSFTDTTLNAINAARNGGNLQNFPFTNTVEVYKQGEPTLLKSDSDTVKYEYDKLVSKEDVSEESSGSISKLKYSVVINEEAQPINGGKQVRLTDVIPETMILDLGKVTVTGYDGQEISSCTVSYEESTRRLEISVPDSTKATVTFEAIPTAGNVAYVNTVTLSGENFSQTDTVEREHIVSAAGTLTGTSNAVKIKKVDKYNITKPLQGAEFTFYQCRVDGNGRIQEETSIGTCISDADGMVTSPSVTPGVLYSWIETDPPSGYIIANSAERYFVVYQELKGSGAVTVPWNKLSSATRTAIREKYSNCPGNTATTPVYIGTGETNSPYWLEINEYPSGTGYSSLQEEVNAINLKIASDLVDLVNTNYDGQKTAVCVSDGYTWQVENIKDDVTTIELKASKALTGRAMKAGEFTFQLYDETVADEVFLLQTLPNPEGAAGEAKEITFDPRSIVVPGTYKYRIEEKPGNASYMTYDPAIYRIIVTADYDANNNNKLTAHISGITKTVGENTVTLTGSALTSPVPFANTYTQPSGSLTLTGTKTLTGRKMAAQEFNFVVMEGETQVATGYNASETADGTAGAITFTSINYTEVGNHTYTVTEAAPTDPNVIQTGTKSYQVIVKVTDPNNDGNLVATITRINGAENGTIDFTNEYVRPVGDLKVKKTVSGAPASAASKKYKIRVTQGTTVFDQTGVAITDGSDGYVEIAADETATWKDLSIGDYVIEEDTDDAKIDNYSHSVTGTGAVTIAVGERTATVANRYTQVTGSLKIKKTVSGAPDSEATKTYKIRVKQGDTVYGQDGKPVAAGSDGYVTFTADDEKTWENLPIGDYTIEEDEDGAQIEIYTLAVKGTENSVKVEAGKTAEATVTNTYAPIYGSAKLTKTGKDGKPLAGAKFDLYKVVEGGTDIKVNTDALATDDDGVITVGKLIPGQSYYFVETAAPEGYILPEGDAAQTTALTVEKDTETPAELKFTMTNEETVVWLSKVDATTEEELDGATIQIIDSEGNVVVEWVSEAGKPLEVTGLKTGEEYTLHETAAPNGYFVTSDTKFVIDEHGKVTGSATVSVDENGNQTLLVKDEMKKLSAAVKKVWEDDNDRDALREDSIEVKLLQNGETYDTVTLSAKNNWTYIATGLPAVDEKLEDYVYEWEETGTVEGYTATKKTEGILTVLTNTHGPEETAVTVKKVWNDNDNAAGKRPESVTVQLYADGQAAGKPVELNAANGWSATWDHLVKNTNEDGQAKPIVYTVAETEIPKGYTSKITGSMAAGYVITNTLETGKLVIEKQFDIQVPVEGPEEEELTTDIEVVKLWVDNDNRDGNRPASVTVHLYAGGTEVRSAELTAAGGWRKTFGGLPKFVDGRPIKYFVTEDPVEWYVPEIRGFTITNRYTPEVTSVTVKKVWNDEDNKRGRRPLSVAMKLNNGTIVLLSEENNWTETVTELPARVNGKPAEYFWTEQSSLGYVQENVETKDGVTVFTNKLWTGPEGTPAGKKPRTYGETLYNIGEYKTPLGVNEIINHVGDCFD